MSSRHRANDVPHPHHSRLAGRDLIEWIALRRVSEGGVATPEQGRWWLQNGLAVAGWLHDPLNDLVATQHVTLTPPDPDCCGMRRATLTAAGWTRFAELTDLAEGKAPPLPSQDSGDHTEPTNCGDSPRVASAGGGQEGERPGCR
ncbi:MAG: hypothetical protein ABR608_14005 [Pseudonocardiaceae bacterium]